MHAGPCAASDLETGAEKLDELVLRGLRLDLRDRVDHHELDDLPRSGQVLDPWPTTCVCVMSKWMRFDKVFRLKRARDRHVRDVLVTISLGREVPVGGGRVYI